jgi:acyl carrier protein
MQIKIEDLNSLFNKAFDADVIITIDSVREDLEQWDSINQLNLVVELEDFYKISFSKEEIESLNSVKQIIAAIESK